MKTRLLIILGLVFALGFTGTAFAQEEQSFPPCTSDREACMNPPICENIIWDCPPSEDIFDVVIEPSSGEELIDPSIDYSIELNGINSGGQYTISNATIHNVTFDEQQPTLIFKLKEAENGHMLIMIASGLFYPPHLEYQSEYVVLADGMEIQFIQHSPIVLEIPFKEGTKEISIVGGFYPRLGEPDCPLNTELRDGVCNVIDGWCEPDIDGNTSWCGPQYDYLKIILSNPSAFLFVFGTPSIIAGIVIGVIIWRKRK